MSRAASPLPINRRHLVAGLAATALAPVPAAVAQVSGRTAWPFSFAGLDGGEIRLSQFEGRPVLVVNTASFCGYASQFGSLQTLYARLSPRGLAMIGVPSNDFGGQEPGPPAETIQIARSHGVAFPMAAKTKVVGADAHPFYRWTAAERPREVPRWNFHKYLIGIDGRIAEVFATPVDPLDARITVAVEKELAKRA
ncbi:glutathione peroxidase [Alsobacter sp. R-9]